MPLPNQTVYWSFAKGQELGPRTKREECKQTPPITERLRVNQGASVTDWSSSRALTSFLILYPTFYPTYISLARGICPSLHDPCLHSSVISFRSIHPFFPLTHHPPIAASNEVCHVAASPSLCSIGQRGQQGAFYFILFPCGVFSIAILRDRPHRLN